MKDDDPTGDVLRARYSFSDWQSELQYLGARELEELYIGAHDSVKPYVGAINFHVAVMDRFMELGYQSNILSGEEKAACRDQAEAVADIVRHTWKDDRNKIDKFETAYENAINFYVKFYNTSSVE